jgi:hypothetical protein
LNADAVLQRSTRAAFQVVAGEAILIHLDSGTYFSLNKVGTEFWEMLDGRKTIHEHAQAIAAQYNQVTNAIADDVRGFAEHIAGKYESAESVVRDIRQLADAILAKYHVETQRVTGDLIELATKMAADKLVDEA